MIWLLSISFAGRDWRFASQPCDPLEGSTPRPHRGGLEVEPLREEAPLFEISTEQRQVEVAVIWPEAIGLIQAGHDLASAVAELALWDEADDYADREIQILGTMTQPRAGGLDEPVTATLQEQPFTDAAQIPDTSAAVTLTSWPMAHDDVQGRPYPLIAGLPGHITGRAAVARDIPGSIGLLVDVGAGKVLIAGHRVLAASVTLTDSDGTAAALGVAHAYDGLGRLCAQVDVTGSGLIEDDAEYGVAWPSAGGLANTDAGELQGAGQILVWALQQSRLRIDRARMLAAAPLFDWLICVVDLEEACGPWEWAEGNLLPLLPVSLMPGGRGLRPVVWRFEARREDAILHLVEGEGLVRTGLVSYGWDDDAVRNRVVVKWARNASTGALEEYVAVGPGPDLTDEREHGCRYAEISRSRLRRTIQVHGIEDDGVREEVVEAPILASERAAVQVALWMVAARYRPPRLITYYASHRIDVDLGDVVLLVDADLGFDCPALVQARTITDRDEAEITLIPLEAR